MVRNVTLDTKLLYSVLLINYCGSRHRIGAAVDRTALGIKGGSALRFSEHQSHQVNMSRPSFAYQQPFVVNLPGSPSSKSPVPRPSGESQDSSNTYKISKQKSSLKAAFMRPFRSSSNSGSSPTSESASQSSNLHSLVSVPSKHKPKDKSGNSRRPGDPMPGVRMTFV